MSKYQYFIFDQSIPARRKGNNAPEIWVGEEDGKWAHYPDVERFDFNCIPITEAEFNKEFAKYFGKRKNPVKEAQSGLDNPTLKTS